jgi:fatty acid desaturase
VSSDSGYDFFAPAATPSGGPSSAASRAPGGLTPPARAGTPSHLAPATSRWAKSDTTFGPVGRIMTTIFMVIPMLFFVASGVFTQDPFVLVGAVIWGGLMVVGLRHIWAAVKR